MLTSQGDKEQIFVHDAGTPAQSLSVLALSGSVDDTAWASDATGAIYTTDNSDNTVYKITGPFHRGEVFVAATPCDANNAPATCPGAGVPAQLFGPAQLRHGRYLPRPANGRCGRGPGHALLALSRKPSTLGEQA